MDKKVILITGTNSGFGWLHTHTLANAGHTVYATMRDVHGRNAGKAATLNALPNVQVLEIEITDSASVQLAIETVVKQEGKIDVLVNNAGQFISGLAEACTEEDLESLLNVHVKGMWRTIKAVLPHMRRQGEGLIINTSSVLGRFSSPFMTMYNAAKFTVEGLSEGLHYEVRPLGIDVAILQPGAFPTEIFSNAHQGSDSGVAESYGVIGKVPEQISMGIGQLFETLKPDPQAVADAVLQLVETPKGKRPLRTVVDAVTGQYVEAANNQVKIGYDQFVTAFGLQDLLS